MVRCCPTTSSRAGPAEPVPLQMRCRVAHGTMQCRTEQAGGGTAVDQLTLEAKVANLEDGPPIRLDRVDLTVRDLAQFRDRFDEILGSIAAEESASPHHVVDVTTILPDLEAHELRSVDVRSSHGLAHAAEIDPEAAHLEFHRTAVAVHRSRLTAYKVAPARGINVSTHRPIGAAPLGRGPARRAFAQLGHLGAEGRWSAGHGALPWR